MSKVRVFFEGSDRLRPAFKQFVDLISRKEQPETHHLLLVDSEGPYLKDRFHASTWKSAGKTGKTLAGWWS